MADGARKYGPFNWRETSVRLSVYLEAAQRHLEAYRDGQDRAEDSGYLHLSHAAACLAIIADADALGMLIDDRPAPGPAAAMLAERDGTQPAAEPDEAPLSFGFDVARIAGELGYCPGCAELEAHCDQSTPECVGEPVVNLEAVDDSEGAEPPRGMAGVGDLVRITPGSWAQGVALGAGMVGFVREVLPSGFRRVDVPGCPSAALHRCWHLGPRELEVIPS
jgi:hypothetical protein